MTNVQIKEEKGIIYCTVYFEGKKINQKLVHRHRKNDGQKYFS